MNENLLHETKASADRVSRLLQDAQIHAMGYLIGELHDGDMRNPVIVRCLSKAIAELTDMRMALAA